MKRLFIAALVLVAMTVSVSAQELSPHYLGIKGGVNYMKLHGDDLENIDYLVGYAFGAFYQCQLHPRLAISPEIYYSLKGSKNSEGDYSLDLGYIDIPILFKLMFPTGSTVSPCIYAGGYLAFLMSAKTEDFDVKEEFKSTDSGFIIGGSLDLMLKEGTQLVNLDIRFTYGLTSLGEDTPVDVYNSGFQFLMGWGFNL